MKRRWRTGLIRRNHEQRSVSAHRGFPRNMLDCVRISMMARSTECSTKRPDTNVQDPEPIGQSFLLRHTARPYKTDRHAAWHQIFEEDHLRSYEACRSRPSNVHFGIFQCRPRRKPSIGRKPSITGIFSSAWIFEHQGYGKDSSHCMIGSASPAGSTLTTSMSIASFFTRPSMSVPKYQA